MNTLLTFETLTGIKMILRIVHPSELERLDMPSALDEVANIAHEELYAKFVVALHLQEYHFLKLFAI